MSLGIVVDGDAEAIALGEITSRLQGCPRQVLRPIYASLQPKASPAQIAKAASPRIELLQARGATRLVVLIDREDRTDSPSAWASAIQIAFGGIGIPGVAVVVKNRKFENWLASHPNALRSMPKRWRVTNGFENAVSPNRADSVVDAEMLLNTIVQGKSRYHKRHDAIRIAQRIGVLDAAANSRAFRS